MKPRIRNSAVALVAGVGARGSPRGRRRGDAHHQGTQLTLSGDGAADTITLGANATGMLTHNLPAAGGLADATDFNPDPALVTTLPANGTITVTSIAGGGNDTVNLSAAARRPPTINGGDGDDTLTGSPTPTRSRAGTGTTASPASAATRPCAATTATTSWSGTTATAPTSTRAAAGSTRR